MLWGWSPHVRISVLRSRRKGTRALSLSISSMWEHSEKVAIYTTGRGLCPAPKSTGTLTLDLSPPGPWEMNVCCYSSLSQDMRLTQSCDGTLNRTRSTSWKSYNSCLEDLQATWKTASLNWNRWKPGDVWVYKSMQLLPRPHSFFGHVACSLTKGDLKQ